MPSKILQLQEEMNLIKTAINKIKSGPHANQKKVEYLTRAKKITQRINEYGKRGNLYKITIVNESPKKEVFDFYYTDIDEEDIPFLVIYNIGRFQFKPDSKYFFDKIELGKEYLNIPK